MLPIHSKHSSRGSRAPKVASQRGRCPLRLSPRPRQHTGHRLLATTSQRPGCLSQSIKERE
jgi:hypothetical protein